MNWRNYYQNKKKLHEIRPGKTPLQSHRHLIEELRNSSEQEILLVDQYEELVTICDEEQEKIKKLLPNCKIQF